MGQTNQSIKQLENKLIIELDTIVAQFDNFIDATAAARESSEMARDYRDHKQWTTEERQKIEDRGQAAIVFNYISRKVNALVGLENSKRTDPKAYPRTPQHEKDAEAITDALRYVADNNDLDMLSMDVFENQVVEGYGACTIEVAVKRGNYEIQVNHISWDRFYYDPHSRRKDFKDAKYMGIVIWMDFDDLQVMFPDKVEEIDSLFDHGEGVEDSTFEDKPTWIDRKRKRVRVLQHFFVHQGVWHFAYLTKSMFLLDPSPSPYLNEDGEPECLIEAQSAYVNRDNERYGEVLGMLDPQDEVNHRRSKALHLLSVRQTYGNRTAVEDPQTAKEELAKADGHVVLEGAAKFGDDFGVIPTNDLAIGQVQMLEDAKAELDAASINPSLTGKDDKTVSGRAIQARQVAGQMELDPLFSGHRSWKKRVYRQIWSRVKQFWTHERWIRVTDNESNVRFVGLNQPQTTRQMLEEVIQDKQNPKRGNAYQMLQTLEYNQDPRLDEIKRIKNNTSETDVDIILDEGPDSVTIQQEQFEALLELAKIYGPDAVPFDAVVELSSIRNKERFLEKLKGGEITPEQEALQNKQIENQMLAQDLELEDKAVKIGKEQALIRKTNAETEQKQVETGLLITQPAEVTNVSV